MENLNQEKLKKNTKVQNINCGVSTRNFVATQLLQKKWLKVKQSPLHIRQLQENYYFTSILLPLMRKQNKRSLLSVEDISIHTKLKQEEGLQSMLYYLERPFLSMSLNDVFQRKRQLSYPLVNQLSQLFELFLENSSLQLPLIIPCNFLFHRRWNKQLSIRLNYTSLVGFQFFIQRGDIFTSKFRQISSYLHPSIYNDQTQQLNICFQTKLYAFALSILTLIIQKPLCSQFQSLLEKYQNTVNVMEIKNILAQNQRKIANLLDKKIIADQFESRRQSGQIHPKLRQFIGKVVRNNRFRSWKEVIDFFDPKFFINFQQQLNKYPNQYLKLAKLLLKSQTKDMLQLYRRMGIINPTLQNIEGVNDFKELMVYFMLKVYGFQEIKYIFQRKSNYYQPSRYNRLKRLLIQQTSTLLPSEKQPNKPNQPNQLSRGIIQMDRNEQSQQYELNPREEVEQSLNYNIFSFESEGDNDSIQTANIYVPNGWQKTLDIYGSRMWL